jgi:hypothetical protein
MLGIIRMDVARIVSHPIVVQVAAAAIALAFVAQPLGYPGGGGTGG